MRQQMPARGAASQERYPLCVGDGEPRLLEGLRCPHRGGGVPGVAVEGYGQASDGNFNETRTVRNSNNGGVTARGVLACQWRRKILAG